MSDIGYSGQYLDNKDFRIKVKTGTDISNITGDAIAGEMFLTTGDNPAFYICTETSSDDYFEIYRLADASGLISGGNFNEYNYSTYLERSSCIYSSAIPQNEAGEGDVLSLRNTPFSISMWIKIDRTLRGTTYLARKAGNSYAYDFQWSYNPLNGDYGIAIYDGNGASKLDNISITGNSAGIVELEKWHHYLFTFDGGTSPNGMKLYIDGNLQTTTAATNGTFIQCNGVNSMFKFGARTNPSQHPIIGKYHEIAFFDSALNATQALDIYTNKDLSAYNPNYWWNFGKYDSSNGGTSFYSHGSTTSRYIHIADNDIDNDGVIDTTQYLNPELVFDSPHNNI